jgi:hypothetical protein
MQGRLDKLDHQGALRTGDPRTQALKFTPRSYSGRVVQHEPPEVNSAQPRDDRSTPDEQEKLSVRILVAYASRMGSNAEIRSGSVNS